MEKRKRKSERSGKTLPEEIAEAWLEELSDTDVLGMYTGIPRDDELPVQDADDL